MEPATSGLQGEGLNNCTREASNVLNCVHTITLVHIYLVLFVFSNKTINLITKILMRERLQFFSNKLLLHLFVAYMVKVNSC